MLAMPRGTSAIRPLVAAVLLLLIVAVPAAALACPACASSNASKYNAVFPVLVGFIGIPFVISGAAFLVIRRALRGGDPAEPAVPLAVGPDRLVYPSRARRRLASKLR